MQQNGNHTAEKHFYLHDRLGSVRQITDESGTVVKYYTFDAFGNTVESDGTFEDPFRFTGQWFDAEIGQYYLRARQSDPQLMRFTAFDPVRGQFDEPMTLHKYLYCRNDSINKIDPSGLITAYATLTGMGSYAWSGVGQFGLVVDNKGNFGIIAIGGGGIGTPALFGGVSFAATSADTIYGLEGWGVTAGATIGPTWMPGVDVLFGLQRPPYWGLELNFGKTWTPTKSYGYNFEIHTQITHTSILGSVNVYDFLQGMGVDLSEIQDMKRKATDLCDFLDFIGQGEMVPLPPQYLAPIMGYFMEN